MREGALTHSSPHRLRMERTRSVAKQRESDHAFNYSPPRNRGSVRAYKNEPNFTTTYSTKKHAGSRTRPKTTFAPVVCGGKEEEPPSCSLAIPLRAEKPTTSGIHAIAAAPSFRPIPLFLSVLSLHSLRPPRRERRRLQQQILPVLVLSNLVQLQLNVWGVVVGVEHVEGLVTVYSIERGAGEDLQG